MVLTFIASMLIGAVRQYPTYSNAWANLRELGGGCGMADDVLVEPDPNQGFLTPVGGPFGALGPSAGTSRWASHPTGCRTRSSPSPSG